VYTLSGRTLLQIKSFKNIIGGGRRIHTPSGRILLQIKISRSIIGGGGEYKRFPGVIYFKLNWEVVYTPSGRTLLLPSLFSRTH
jgi:hypothetical protein